MAIQMKINRDRGSEGPVRLQRFFHRACAVKGSVARGIDTVGPVDGCRTDRQHAEIVRHIPECPNQILSFNLLKAHLIQWYKVEYLGFVKVVEAPRGNHLGSLG